MKTAAELMNEYINSGGYEKLKQQQSIVDGIKATFKERFMRDEDRRFEFPQHNLVCKFVNKKIYETDHAGLLEYLYDLGLFQEVVKINNKKLNNEPFMKLQLEPLKEKSTYYLKPSFKRTFQVELQEFDTAQHENNDLARIFHFHNNKLKHLTNDYDQLKKLLLKDLELLDKNKVAFDVGSISRIANAATYNLNAIVDEFGLSTLIEYGTTDNKLLDKFILRGTISPKEINQFRKVIDERTDFIVIPLDVEQKQREISLERKITASQNLMRAE